MDSSKDFEPGYLLMSTRDRMKTDYKQLYA
jgi:hypothetical protein